MASFQNYKQKSASIYTNPISITLIEKLCIIVVNKAICIQYGPTQARMPSLQKKIANEMSMSWHKVVTIKLDKIMHRVPSR